MSRSWEFRLAILSFLILPDCRKSGATDAVSQADLAAGGGAGAVEDTAGGGQATSGSRDGSSASIAARPAAWGEAVAKYGACPRALCGSRSPREGEPPVRGCGSEAPSSLEAPPPPAPVGPESGGGCGDGGYGYGGGMSGGSPSRARMVRASPPLAPSPPGPVSVGSSSIGFAMEEPAEQAESADELIVMSRSESARPDDDDERGNASAAPAESATQGTLRAVGADGEEAGEFPLEHTEVAAEISGYIARTVVEQRYGNPFDQVIEAVYVFPLPGMAAVNDFVMEIGGRKIVGLIRSREEAERIYQAARARGQTASLLTQERPNIFTQSVANIEPGGKVDIRITYFERLAFERGHYEFMFPMVVGPRYIPGSPSAGGTDAPASAGQAPSGGGGWSPPTDRVPDADRITPPVMRPGERSGHDIGLTVTLDAGLPITDIATVTHCVEVEEFDPTRRVVKLSSSDSIPNRDFVLRWTVAGAETQFGVLAHRGDNGGFLTVMMQPPLAPQDEQVTPREITFIIDVSGSQMGLPIGVSKEIVRRTLDELRSEDSFNIFFFASGNGQLWEEPRPRTAENVAEAREFVGSLCGGGGTEMLEGIRRALQGRHDPKFLQMYVFLTDGYVGNEEEILRVVKEERGEARFFAFGIGSSVNRYLVDGVGEFGGGSSWAVLPRDPDHAGKAVQRLFDMIDSPVLVDVSIDWNGLPVEDVYPRKLPDLFAGQTIAVVARYSRAAQGTAYVEARVGSRRVRAPVVVDLPEREAQNEALAPIWARWRIADLSKEMITADESRGLELKRQITDLALDFRLVSQYTAFVAVDESRIVGDGNPLRVIQPVEMPEGVSYEGVFGEQPVGVAFDVEAWGLTLQMSESGKVRVGAVRNGGAAARAGIAAGAVLSAVDGTLVHDLAHLEGLVLQGSGDSVKIGFEPGGEVSLPVR